MYKIKNFNELANLIEYTNLNNLASDNEMKNFLKNASELNFEGVVINPSYLNMASEFLKNKQTKVITTVGFPLGFENTESKIKEAQTAIKNGADGVEMVINLSDIKNQRFDNIRKEVEEVKKVIVDKSLKVIIETKALEDNEKIKIAEVLESTNIDYIVTSTGFVNPNTIYEDVNDITLIKKYAPTTKIKVTGINQYKIVNQLLTAGADLIGSTEGYNIVNDYKELREHTQIKPKPIKLD